MAAFFMFFILFILLILYNSFCLFFVKESSWPS